MSNQEFCYWLQGYFEISRNQTLSKNKVLLIMAKLGEIEEAFGDFTQWLWNVCEFFKKVNYKPQTLTLFTQEITRNLNAIFMHVIDNSYTEGPPPTAWQLIHDGKFHDQ